MCLPVLLDGGTYMKVIEENFAAQADTFELTSVFNVDYCMW